MGRVLGAGLESRGAEFADKLSFVPPDLSHSVVGLLSREPIVPSGGEIGDGRGSERYPPSRSEALNLIGDQMVEGPDVQSARLEQLRTVPFIPRGVNDALLVR